MRFIPFFSFFYLPTDPISVFYLSKKHEINLMWPKDVQYLPAGILNWEKYFVLITTMILCAERPSGYIEDHYKRYESIPQHTISIY